MYVDFIERYMEREMFIRSLKNLFRNVLLVVYVATPKRTQGCNIANKVYSHFLNTKFLVF